MEFCSAEMVVITLMTENMPIVIPDVVRADRNLFTPNARQAIPTISNMSIASNRE
jgi:hypothetical protein